MTVSYQNTWSYLQNCYNRRVASLDSSELEKWRICYEGGEYFRDHYLEQYTGSVGKEGNTDFVRRKKLTPIPTPAKDEINKVKNSIANRLTDVTRLGGPEGFEDAAKGLGRGVDMRGSSMHKFLVTKVLPEMLVMGSAGVLIDAPAIPSRPEGLRRIDIPSTFQPFLNLFEIEQIHVAVPADPNSPSDWKHLLLETNSREYDLKSTSTECIKTFRYYWLEPERNDLVNVQFFDKNFKPLGDTHELNLDSIPFVNFQLDSLMKETCAYQIAILNMVSADSAYAIDANFSILTRQRDATDIGSHLEGGDGDEDVTTGTVKGLWYNRGLERPGFISPDTSPVEMSKNLRESMTAEIQDKIMGMLSDMGTDGSVESGLSAIGQALLFGENRCWEHWTRYIDSRPDKQIFPTVDYPESWSLKTDEQRIEEAERFSKLANVLVGEQNKKELAKKAAVSLHKGRLSSDVMDSLLSEIDEAPIATSDPDVIIKAKQHGILSCETSAAALGVADPAGEAEKVKEDASDRAAMVASAQADVNSAGRGVGDLQAGDDSEQKAREGEADGAANFKQPGTAGRPSNG